MENTMKKILSLALILGATALMACPMQQGMMNGGMMMQKCQCNTDVLPKPMQNLGLSDEQKEQIKKLREEGKAFHNQQHEKMMAILTPEQRTKLEESMPMMNGKKCNMKQPMMPKDGTGMGCKNCPTTK